MRLNNYLFIVVVGSNFVWVTTTWTMSHMWRQLESKFPTEGIWQNIRFTAFLHGIWSTISFITWPLGCYLRLCSNPQLNCFPTTSALLIQVNQFLKIIYLNKHLISWNLFYPWKFHITGIESRVITQIKLWFLPPFLKKSVQKHSHY